MPQIPLGILACRILQILINFKLLGELFHLPNLGLVLEVTNQKESRIPPFIY